MWYFMLLGHKLNMVGHKFMLLRHKFNMVGHKSSTRDFTKTTNTPLKRMSAQDCSRSSENECPARTSARLLKIWREHGTSRRPWESITQLLQGSSFIVPIEPSSVPESGNLWTKILQQRFSFLYALTTRYCSCYRSHKHFD